MVACWLITDQADVSEIPNAATITPQATRPETDLGSRRPTKALTTNPAKGRSGINASMRVGLPLQCGERVRTERFAVSKQRDHQRETDGGFCRRHGHDEERDDLPVHRAPIAADGDESQVDGIQHDLDREQHRDQVPPQEHAGSTNGEQNARENEVVVQRNHDQCSLRARTTAPTIATRIRIDVASKANACRVNRVLPITATELTDAAAASWENQLRPTCDKAQTISMPINTDRTAPILSPRGPSVAARPKAGSSRDALSSMTTNRNSTMMAPA